MTEAIALTPGEPAGIGPDLCLMLAQQGRSEVLVAIADPTLLERRAAMLDLAVAIRPVTLAALPDSPAPAGQLYVLPEALAVDAAPGRLDPRNSAYVVRSLTRATEGCMNGQFGALVTGPVHKGVINEAGHPFTGHTEFLSERTGGHPVMLLACTGLRVALATTHLPLRDVADAITPERLEQVLRILERDLRSKLGIRSPRIAVCGLNPHAGEGGHLGTEDDAIIRPTIERLTADGLSITGPHSADTLFAAQHLKGIDAVLAMYHDQGLPVLKYRGFGHAVNITLGLPIIRTSVDHGTALNLAGTGRAQPSSLIAAIETAGKMINSITSCSHSSLTMP